MLAYLFATLACMAGTYLLGATHLRHIVRTNSVVTHYILTVHLTARKSMCLKWEL